MEPQLEKDLIRIMRDTMTKHGRNPEDLIIYNGKDENGNTLSVQKQFEIFSSADTAIGIHGSGLASTIWMDPGCHPPGKIKILDILSSP